MNHDYTAARAALRRSIARLAHARDAAGRANLPPAMRPTDARRQIDLVDDLIREAKDCLDAAREACSAEARRGLTVVE